MSNSLLLDTTGILECSVQALRLGISKTVTYTIDCTLKGPGGIHGAVTIATNMAGRGTDIVLGGNWQAEVDKLENPTEAQIQKIKEQWEKDHETVLAAGGLHIIGTERHESRRIDNQLRGRAGRQGDPGSSRFYLSLDDALMRIFASEKWPA